MHELKIGNWKSPDGVRSCLYWEGNTFIHVLTMDVPMVVVKRPKSDLKHIRPLFKKGDPYPMAHLLKYYRRQAKWGISSPGKKMLKAAAAQIKKDKAAAA